MYIISDMPESRDQNKHLVVVTTMDDGIICRRGIKEKTRYHIVNWLSTNLIPKF